MQSTTAEQPSFLTKAEVAATLRVSTRTIDRSMARGDIQSTHFGRRVLIPRSEIERLVRVS